MVYFIGAPESGAGQGRPKFRTIGINDIGLAVEGYVFLTAYDIRRIAGPFQFDRIVAEKPCVYSRDLTRDFCKVLDS